MRRRYPGIALVLAAVLVSACGGSKDAAPKEHPLTLDEATLLASAQYDNYQDEGATFQVATAFLVSHDTLSLQGVVDWKRHTGYAVAVAKGAEDGITEVYWTDKVVLERRPAADAILAGMGLTDVKYFARTPDPSTRLLDRSLAVVFALASTQRDNPQLIQQKPGSAFVRSDTLRGAAVTVLRYGERNLYWLDATTSRMLRFEANAQSGGAPTVVDVLARGKQTITLPKDSEIIQASAMQELYDALLQAATAPQGTGTRSGS